MKGVDPDIGLQILRTIPMRQLSCDANNQITITRNELIEWRDFTGKEVRIR